MYTLVGHPASRALRVLWALEEIGLDYSHIPALPRSDEVLALTPSGKIPVLKVDDAVLTDSVAILTYLADKHGALTYPAGSLDRARQDAVTNYVVAELDAALWTYSKHSFVLPEEHRVAAVKDTAQYEFIRALDHVAHLRGTGPFVAGDRFTIADIILSHCTGWALTRKFPLPGGEFGTYLKALRKRPAMEKVMAMVASAKGRVQPL